MKIPRRFQLKQTISDATDALSIPLVALTGLILGPVGLLMAVGRGRKCLWAAIASWLAGWIGMAVAIACVIAVHNHNDKARLAKEEEKNLASLRAERSEWESLQAEKALAFKRHEFETYRKLVENCERIMKQINSLLDGSTYRGFSRDALVKVGATEVPGFENANMGLSVSMDNTTAEIIKAKETAAAVQKRVEQCLAKLTKALEAFKLAQAQERLRKHAESRIAELNFEIRSGKQIFVHEYIRKSLSLALSDEYGELTRRANDPLAFLNYASKLTWEDSHEPFSLLPNEERIDAIIDDVKEHQFGFDIQSGDDLEVVCVRLSGGVESELAQSEKTFRLDCQDMPYLIEAGAIDYLRRKLTEAQQNGKPAKAALEELLSQDKTYDEVAWKARQKELAERRREEAYRRTQAERQRREEKIRRLEDDISNLEDMQRRWNENQEAEKASTNFAKRRKPFPKLDLLNRKRSQLNDLKKIQAL